MRAQQNQFPGGATSPSDGGQGRPLVRLSHVTLVYGAPDGAAEGAGSGGTRALDDVSLELARGERLCILGANGSGKSTLASVVAGLLAPDAGEVELVGERVFSGGEADLDAYRRARRSLGLVFQNPDDQIVTSVVEDDVAFGPENLGLPRKEIRRRVGRELHRVALDAYADADPTHLSGGQKQRVAIAGALAMEPRVLVLDEPSSLLDVRGREAIRRVMGRLAAAGTALVHVTHFMEEAVDADRVIVLDHGRVALSGTPEEVFSAGDRVFSLALELPFPARVAHRLGLPATCEEDELVEAVAGAFEAVEPPAAPVPAEEAAGPRESDAQVEVEHCTFSYGPRARALDDVSLRVERGESVAIVGQTGSGKSTLLRLLCGLEVPDSGRVAVCGHGTSDRRGRRAVRSAVGYVMQHPERQLFAETVEADVAFGPRNLGLSSDEVEKRVDDVLSLVGLAQKRHESPFSLSGGQRRLCALAGVLAMEPRVLVLDEPTAGLDPRGRELLRDVLRRLHALGVTLVQVTHSMEDAARAERVVVLDQSRLLFDGTPAEVFRPEHERRLAEAGLGLPRSLRLARDLEGRGVGPLGLPLTTDELVSRLARKGA